MNTGIRTLTEISSVIVIIVLVLNLGASLIVAGLCHRGSDDLHPDADVWVDKYCSLIGNQIANA
jgi:hypothetical protein